MYVWEFWILDYLILTFAKVIFNRWDWLWSPANIKGENKDAKIYVGRSTTVHDLLLCVHAVCMNYVINTFLLVSSSVWIKRLLYFVHGQGEKRHQKHTKKNFVGFHNHFPLLTMLSCIYSFSVGEFHLRYRRQHGHVDSYICSDMRRNPGITLHLVPSCDEELCKATKQG